MIPSRLTVAAILVAALCGSTDAGAYELKHAARGELVRWPAANLAWVIDRSVGSVTGGEAAARNAVAAWSQKDGAPALAIGDASESAHLTPGLDGKNVIFYMPKGYAPAGIALAVTLLSFDDDTGEVLDADIVLNGKYKLGPVDLSAPLPDHAEDPGADTYDIGRVLAHEMGHGLALSDEPARNDVLMYPYVARARALATSPTADDLAGIAALYVASASNGNASSTGTAGTGGSSSSGGCSGAVVARTGPTPAPRAAYLAMGLVVAALVIARSRRRGARGAAGCAAVAAAALVLPLPIPSGAASGVSAPLLEAHVAARAEAATDDAHAVVTSVETTVEDGVFRSVVELTTTRCVSGACPAGARVAVWGGRMGAVRQVVGGALVPSRGDRVSLTLEDVAQIASTPTLPGTRAVRAMRGLDDE